MTPVQAVTLGIVEGLTEFLPISSTAHLIFASRFMKITASQEFLTFFEVFIQSGAILAVFFLYFKLVCRQRNYLVNVVISFFPTAVIGFFLHDVILFLCIQLNLLVCLYNFPHFK